MRIFGELKKRKVLRTAGLYFAVAWGATEILSFLISRIPIFPVWTETAIAILFVLGFPVAVFLSWMFDIDSEGVFRADPTSGVGKGVIVISLAGLLVLTAALSYLLLPQIQKEHGITLAGELRTVAVLPFENLTGDPSLGYLGVGLAEDIRQRLSSYTDLKVIGRVSIAGFAGSGTDLASVRGLLNAGLVIEGNLQNIAGRSQVGISLLDSSSGRQIWSNTFSANESGWGPLRQRIVASLGEQLALTVRVRESETSISDEALDAYLHALSELGQPEVADGWFDEAIRLAPDFADAWARKALLRVDMMWRGMHEMQAWAEGEPAFTQARQIEPENLLADIAEAQLQWLANLDPFASYEVLESAATRAPNHPMVLAGMGTALRYIPGNGQQAISYHRRYLAQDPLNPDAHNRLGANLTFFGQFEEGMEHFERALDLDPGYLLAYEYKANQEHAYNRIADALSTFTLKGLAEDSPSEETRRCLLAIAGELLPMERAEPMLRDAIRRQVGMTDGHAWCSSLPDVLLVKLRGEGRDKDAQVLEAELEEQLTFMGEMAISDVPNSGDCKDNMCELRTSLGDETVDAFLGPDPPLHYFSMPLAADTAQALVDDGRIEEGQRLANLVAHEARDYAGPDGNWPITGVAVGLFALAGDIDSALDYAEQVEPEGFYLLGTELLRAGHYPELANEPRWLAFLERCRVRIRMEVEEFDRRVATGEIVMP